MGSTLNPRRGSRLAHASSISLLRVSNLNAQFSNEINRSCFQNLGLSHTLQDSVVREELLLCALSVLDFQLEVDLQAYPELLSMKQAVMERLPLTLCMEHGPGEGKSFLATHLKKTTIGRTRTNNYPIKDPTVSQKHAFIEWQVDHWVVVDLGSSNGTDVNGKNLVENQPMRLQNGDLIRFGELIKVRVQIEEEEEEEEEDEEEVVEVEVEEEEEMGGEEQEEEEEEEEEQGITVEEWFEQERLRLVRGIQGMADATILEMKQNADELKKRYREHAGID